MRQSQLSAASHLCLDTSDVRVLFVSIYLGDPLSSHILYVHIFVQKQSAMCPKCYEIGRIKYGYANVFYASMISNLFYTFGKQEELQSCVKEQIPRKGLQLRTRGLSMFGEVGLKNTFLFREPECDPVSELMISRQKIGLLVIVSRYGSTSTG